MFIFEWDYQKAASNLQKHGVAFDEAVSVFADPLALTFTDTDHAVAEPTAFQTRADFSWWCINGVRIISARKATRYEKGIYKQG